MLSLDLVTALFVFINLIALYLGLRHFLFKPVNAVIEKRREIARSDLEKAKAELDASNALKLEYEEKLAKAREGADRLLDEARQKSVHEAEQAREEARRQAERIVDEGRVALVMERERMSKELQAEVALLALAMATKVVGENCDTETNRALVEKLVKARR